MSKFSMHKHPKLQVVTTVVNNPEFIVIQNETLIRHLKSDYDFVVFNDAKAFPDYSNGGDALLKSRIDRTCDMLGIRCIAVPNDSHQTQKDAARRCGDAMNYVLTHQRNNPGKYLCLDSDMFLIDDLDVASRYCGYDAAVVLQCRFNREVQFVGSLLTKLFPEAICNAWDALLQQFVRKTFYIWNGIYFFDTTRIKNQDVMDWAPCSGCDVGGNMHKWLSLQIEQKCLGRADPLNHIHILRSEVQQRLFFIGNLMSGTWGRSEIPANVCNNEKLVDFLEKDERNVNGHYFCEIYDNKFLHYRAGGNWRGEGVGFHNKLTQRLHAALCR